MVGVDSATVAFPCQKTIRGAFSSLEFTQWLFLGHNGDAARWSGSPGEGDKAKRQAREFSLVRLSWLLSYSQHVFWMDTDLWTILTQHSHFLVAEDQTDWDIYTYKVFVFISSSKMGKGS